VPYAIERYGKEVVRLYGVMNERLGKAGYISGNSYTIADIATFPWVARHEWHRVDLAAFPNVARWFAEIGARPAVIKGMAIPD
jgi:GSH-dependent disulfide-bond oxidoreductase